MFEKPTHILHKEAILTTLCGLDAIEKDSTSWCSAKDKYNGPNPTCKTCILLDFSDPEKSHKCNCVANEPMQEL